MTRAMQEYRLFIGFVCVGLFISLGGCTQQSSEKEGPAYQVETIKTPAGLSVETGGMDFLSDGRLVACFRRGEVMIYEPKTEKWTLFASGLQDPLGLKVVDSHEMLVMQRSELTRIKDSDRDGQADTYETIFDDFGMSGNYSEFAYGPEIDQYGNYYISLNTASNHAGVRDIIRGDYSADGQKGRMYSAVSYRGWVLKIKPDGTIIPWASGFRSPNGLELDEKGNLFVSDNQGDWLGTSKLYHVQRDHFYGHPSSLVWADGFSDLDPLELPVPILNKMRTKAAIKFPYGFFMNSPTQPLIDRTGGKFGPFAGQMFIGEMNHKRIIRVMLDKIRGEFQGACVSFIDSTGLDIGNNRLAFSPSGDLWVGQTDHGWPGDQGIQKISWNGAVPMEVYDMNITRDGFELTFTKPVDIARASDPSNYHFKRYYYKYHRKYGSAQYAKEQIGVVSAKVSGNHKKVVLTLNKLDPGFIYDLTVDRVTTEKGRDLAHNHLYYTVNYLND